MDKSLIKHVDDLVYDEIFVHNVYHLSDNDVSGKGVLDLGGHHGLFALYSARANAKQIISVEPNHDNLNKYIENTKDINAKVLCAVVSSRKDFISTIDNVGCGSRAGYGTQLVTTISLQSLIELFEPDIDLLLKIDIEGSEYDVFYNNDPELIKKFKIIVMEAHNYNPETRGNEAEQLKMYLESLGYVCEPCGTYWATGFEEKYKMPPAYSYKFIKK